MTPGNGRNKPPKEEIILATNKGTPIIEPQNQLMCPLCNEHFDGDLGSHIRCARGEKSLRKGAQQSSHVLKPGSKCAILVGDIRKLKLVVPN